jgi:hypothetical protein
LAEQEGISAEAAEVEFIRSFSVAEGTGVPGGWSQRSPRQTRAILVPMPHRCGRLLLLKDRDVERLVGCDEPPDAPPGVANQ